MLLNPYLGRDETQTSAISHVSGPFLSVAASTQVGPHRAITPTVETVFKVMGCLCPLPWGSNRTVARIRHPTTTPASGGDTDALIARLRVLPRR